MKRLSAFGLVLLFSSQASAQPLTDLTPPVGDGPLFAFSHHFGLTGGKVVNSPTFELSSGLWEKGRAGIHYATSSNIGGNFNEWEAFLRQGEGVLAYNTAANSLDFRLGGTYDLGALSLRGEGKAFSSGFGVGGATLAIGTGLIWRLNRFLGVSMALDGVVAARNRAAIAGQIPDGLRPAWRLGAQFAIPYTPHSMSLYLTNANTETLQGTSRGMEGFRFGFDFLVPLTAARWGLLFSPPAPTAESP